MKNSTMAQLAIQGHSTRGKEVIQLLEMLGGVNYFKFNGIANDSFYYIRKDNNKIHLCSCTSVENVIFYTLEEFLEKFPYKVGDDVLAYAEGCLAKFTIQDIRWNYELNKVEYKICSSCLDASLMQSYKEENMEKRIEIDVNGKLIIYNDNCTQISNETTTEINGDYLINADNIHKLMVLLENKHLLHSCQIAQYRAYASKIQDFNLYTCDKELLDAVDEKLKTILKEIEILSKQKDILESLIDKHNEKCGLFHKEIELPEEYNTLNRELW